MGTGAQGLYSPRKLHLMRLAFGGWLSIGLKARLVPICLIQGKLLEEVWLQGVRG